ncbi:MAG: exodeoxyribonuclease VII small subunit [Candidatus Saccharimonadales bacterium]
MANNSKDYQTLNGELEAVLAQLQDPALGVDQALKLYQRGQKISHELENYLNKTKNKLKQLDQIPDSKKL